MISNSKATSTSFFYFMQKINRRSAAALLYSATNKKMTHPFRRQTSNEDQRRHSGQLSYHVSCHHPQTDTKPTLLQNKMKEEN